LDHLWRLSFARKRRAGTLLTEGLLLQTVIFKGSYPFFSFFFFFSAFCSTFSDLPFSEQPNSGLSSKIAARRFGIAPEGPPEMHFFFEQKGAK